MLITLYLECRICCFYLFFFAFIKTFPIPRLPEFSGLAMSETFTRLSFAQFQSKYAIISFFVHNLAPNSLMQCFSIGLKLRHY
jgi:hypothetical protein